MTPKLFSPLVIISISFCLSLLFTLGVRAFLIKRAFLDKPNERSSHSVPVPRGGGWALVGVLVPGLLLTTFLEDNFYDYAPLIAGLLLLIFISWLDDRKGVHPLKRLSIHILAACLGSLSFSHDATLFQGALPFWLDRLIMILGWAWFTNLYNFMDGIDGITGSETIALATGSCLILSAGGFTDLFMANLTFLLTGSCLGFLVLNWHPAKIFLGDVGSVPLGFLVGFLLLSLATKGYLIPALIMPLYYLADSGITIIKRSLKKEKIWQAHRQHFYQKATLALKRHDTVVLWILVANLALICAALEAISKPRLALAFSVLIVAILLRKMHKSAL